MNDKYESFQGLDPERAWEAYPILFLAQQYCIFRQLNSMPSSENVTHPLGAMTHLFKFLDLVMLSMFSPVGC